MNSSLYVTSFSLKTLDHLGINLYGNATAVIAELIANSHDAGARRVDITVNSDKIIVQDDGVGMSLQDINTKYLRFGYEKRKELTTFTVVGSNPPVERHVMGRKGIGKISTLSIAREIEVQTVSQNEKHIFVIERDVIEDLQELNSTEYSPRSLDSSLMTIEKGTRIELRKILPNVTGLDKMLRYNLARIFPTTGPEVLFDIYVDGSPITIDDRKWFDNIQFLWCFGTESEKFASYCKRLEKHFIVDNVVSPGRIITGWLATTFQPSDIEVDQRIVTIYAHNKLIQRDLLYDYKNYKVSSSYLIGEVYASFMDTDVEADIVLSDRQRINPNDPRYIALRSHVVSQVEYIDKKWDNLRKTSPSHKPRKRRSSVSFTPTNNPDTKDVIQDPLKDGDSGSSGNLTHPTTPPPSGNSVQVDPNSPPESNPIGNTSNPNTTPPRISNAPPRNQAGVVFLEMKDLIHNSTIELAFQNMIRSDLKESRSCYDNSAFKACVVMLGAVLEGTMLGVLRQPNAVSKIASTTFSSSIENMLSRSVGNQIQRSRMNPADLTNKIADELTFEMMRQLVEDLIPAIKNLKVQDIQQFRNAVHPWKGVKNPTLFSNIDLARSTQYIMSCKIIMEQMVKWVP